MDRASDYGSEGWEFKSLRARQLDLVLATKYQQEFKVSVVFCLDGAN